MTRNFAGNVGTGGKPTTGEAEARSSNVDPLLTARDVALDLSCGQSTVWRWAAEGVIPQPLKIGGSSRWRQSWIEKVKADAEASREAA